MTNPDDDKLDLLVSLDRIINEAERARILRDRLLAQAREKAAANSQKAKMLGSQEGACDG